MTSVAKWECPKCTYLNYNASIKCSICYALKPSTSLEMKDNNQETAATIMDDTPIFIEDCATSAFSSASHVGAEVSQGTSILPTEREVEQMLYDMNEEDRRFLQACIGAAEDDTEQVLAFVHDDQLADLSSQDKIPDLNKKLSRTITSKESMVLGKYLDKNREEVYGISRSLVDIALLQNSTGVLALLLSPADESAKKNKPSHVADGIANKIREALLSAIKMTKNEERVPPRCSEGSCIIKLRILERDIARMTYSLPAQIRNFKKDIWTKMILQS
eukprot:UC4_evm2s1148